MDFQTKRKNHRYKSNHRTNGKIDPSCDDHNRHSYAHHCIEARPFDQVLHVVSVQKLWVYNRGDDEDHDEK